MSVDDNRYWTIEDRVRRLEARSHAPQPVVSPEEHEALKAEVQDLQAQVDRLADEVHELREQIGRA